MSFIRAGGCTLHYEEHGSGDTLLLLPGLLGSIETTWRRFIPDLASESHVVAVDLRGHGGTDNPSGRLALPGLLEDLATLLDTLGIERADICGYSLGGYLGLAYGIDHPHRVRSLVMHAVKVFWDGTARANALAGMDPDRLLRDSPEQAAALREAHAPGNGPDGWLALLGAARELIAGLERSAIGERDIARAWFPVLVTGGERDTMVPPDEAEQLAALLPAALHLVLPGVRHGMQSVRTQDFLAAVLPFLARVRSGGGAS